MTENLPIARVLSEMDQIEAVMRTDRPAYNRDVAMQSRYRDLIVQKQGGAQPTMLGQEDNRPLVGILSPGEYSAVCKQYRVTPNYDQYMRSMRTISDVALAMPEGEQRSFVDSFDRLPEKVQIAAMREALSRVPMVNPTSDAQLSKFAQEPEGAVLVREWGHLAARNHACCRARVLNIADELYDQSEALMESFLAWLFDRLSVNQRIALYRRMVA